MPFIELHSVDSTNNYAMGLVRAAMAQHGLAVFAHEQTKGRGQRSKQWLSDKNSNIALSLVLEPGSLKMQDMFLLSMCIAAGTLKFFNRFAGNEAAIKWPNDIYWRDRKAAGILIENIWQGNVWKFAIAGIGINVNQVDFGPLGNRAVSLLQITGKKYEPVELARQLHEAIMETYDLLQKDPDQISNYYRQSLYKRNEYVHLKKESRVFHALVKDVNDHGQLVVQTHTEEYFDVGEVEWLPDGA